MVELKGSSRRSETSSPPRPPRSVSLLKHDRCQWMMKRGIKSRWNTDSQLKIKDIQQASSLMRFRHLIISFIRSRAVQSGARRGPSSQYRHRPWKNEYKERLPAISSGSIRTKGQVVRSRDRFSVSNAREKGQVQLAICWWPRRVGQWKCGRSWQELYTGDIEG